MLPAIISNALPGTVVDSSVTGQAASGNQIAQLGYVSQQQPPQELAYRSGHPFLSAYVDPRKPAQDPSQVSPNYDYSLGSGTTSSSGRSTSRSRNSGSQYTDIYGQTSDQSYQQYPYSQNTARSQYSDDQDSGSQTSNSLSRNPSSSNYRYSQNGQKSNDASGRSSQLSGQNGEQFASGDLAPYPSSLSSQDGTQNLQNVAYRPSQSETTNRQQANSGSQDPNYQVTPSMDGSSQTNPSDYQLNREEAPYNPTSGTLQDPGQAFDASTPSVVALPPATPLNGTAYGGSSDASYGGYPGAPLDPTRTRPLSRNEASAALNAAAERSAAAVAAAVQNSVSASQAASSAAAAAAAAQSLAAAQAAAAAADQASDVEMAQMNSCAEKRNRKDKKLKFDTKGCRQCCEDIKYLVSSKTGPFLIFVTAVYPLPCIMILVRQLCG